MDNGLIATIVSAAAIIITAIIKFVPSRNSKISSHERSLRIESNNEKKFEKIETEIEAGNIRLTTMDGRIQKIEIELAIDKKMDKK